MNKVSLHRFYYGPSPRCESYLHHYHRSSRCYSFDLFVIARENLRSYCLELVMSCGLIDLIINLPSMWLSSSSKLSALKLHSGHWYTISSIVAELMPGLSYFIQLLRCQHRRGKREREIDWEKKRTRSVRLGILCYLCIWS